MQIFTPINADTGERMELNVCDKEAAKLPLRGRMLEPVTFTDTDGRKWKWETADCGASCYCDAIVSRVDDD